MADVVDIARYRDFPQDWTGVVFVVDVDRTYLATRFSTVGGILRIPGESVGDKQDLPGMAALLREVRRGPQRTSRETPLSFVSASPAQLRKTIERKLTLDGIGFDATVFKNWSRLIRRLQFKRLRDQLAFKVTALLSHRATLPRRADEVLLGDDLEADPLAFAIYADLLAGRVSSEQLPVVLTRCGLGKATIADIERLRSILGDIDGRVEAAFIRMERTQNPAAFLPFRGRIAGCRHAAQMAAALWERGHVSLDGVARVIGALGRRGQQPADLALDLRDAIARGLITPEGARALMTRLHREDSSLNAAVEAETEWRVATDRDDPWIPAELR